MVERAIECPRWKDASLSGAPVFGGSLVLGLSLVGFAVWLQWNERHGWSSESLEAPLDAKYYLGRSKSRSRIHRIIAGCGLLAMVAAFAGPATPIWVAAWMSIMVALMVIILLALLDAWRTHRYYAAKLPEARRQTLGDQQDS